MNNKEFLFNYLDKNYCVGISGIYLVFIDKTNDQKYSPDNFIVHIEKIFSAEFVGLALQWIEKTTLDFGGGICEYLSTCSVKLSRVGWDIYNSDGEIISMDQVIDELYGIGEENKVRFFYEKWFRDKTVEITEKTMNIENKFGF